MKFRTITFAFLFLLFFNECFSQQKYTGDSWAEINKNGQGIISLTYYQASGLIYEEDGKMKGVYADIINSFKEYVKKRHGLVVDFRYVAEEKVWTDFLGNIESSQSGVMGVSNVTITDERKKTFDFTPVVIANPMVFLTHSSVPTIRSYDELKTKLKTYKAIVVKGSTQLEHMVSIKTNYWPEMEIVYAEENQGEVLVDVISKNKNLFAITDFTEYYDAIKRKLPIKRHSLKMNNDKEYLGMILPKNSDWTPIWNEFLTDEYKTGNEYKEIIANNLGSQFQFLIK